MPTNHLRKVFDKFVLVNFIRFSSIELLDIAMRIGFCLAIGHSYAMPAIISSTGLRTGLIFKLRLGRPKLLQSSHRIFIASTHEL